MKKSVLIILISFFSFLTGYTQNKTLGVGATTPNPNAALHVESPTNNQGFIMPRLTTANRTASGFQGVLTSSDIGLMVYDTDLKAIYIWDGVKWGSAAKLALPYQDSVLTAPANSNLLKLYYGGTAPGNVGVAYFENLNPNNAFGPLFVRTLGTGSASNFFIANAASAGSAVNGTTNGSGSGVRGVSTGTGNAGNFTINNAANTTAALRATTNGSGAAINSSNTGVTDGFAGLFSNTQASNNFPAIQANTAGTGTGVRVIQNATSVGGGMDVYMQNPTSSAPGFSVDQQGTGPAANLQISNAGNTAPALSINHSGTGNAITANRPIQASQFIGDGSGLTNLPSVSFPFATSLSNATTLFDITNTGTGRAGTFQINNASNTQAAIFAATNGTGTVIRADHNGASGYAGVFQNINAANTNASLFASTAGNGPAFHADTDQGGNAIEGVIFGTGTGSAGKFENTNAANGSSIVNVTNNGTGNALQVKSTGTGENAYFEVNNATSTGSPVVGITNGTGSAGFFQVNNKPNGGTALLGTTNSDKGGVLAPVGVYGESTGTGSLGGAFRVNNPGNGYPALYAETNGTGGTGFTAKHIGPNGNAGYFEVFDPGNAGTGVYAKTYGTGYAVGGLTTGTGPASRFEISNSGNTNAALEAITDGSGPSISSNNNGTGFGIYARAAGTTDAIYAEKQATDGAGSAGNFWNKNSSNGASVVFAATNAATGTALGLINSADGNALSIFQGGLKLSVSTISTGGTITQLAAIYNITTTASVTLPAATDGQVCWVFNGSSGVLDLTNAGLIEPTVGNFNQYIYMGQWRPIQ